MYSVLAAPSATTALGATLSPSKSSAAFRVWAPNASAVVILLQPDSFTPQTSFSLQPDTANQPTGRRISPAFPRDTYISSRFKTKVGMRSIRVACRSCAPILVAAR
jgi:hypothetical protein